MDGQGRAQDGIAVAEIALTDVACRAQVRERFDEKALAGLAKSLEKVGLQQPVIVRREGDELVAVDGERRVRAARMLGWSTIPVIIQEGALEETTVLERQMVTNCQREGLSPIEKARAIDELMKTAKLPASAVAERLGFSEATASRLLALLVLPEAMREAVHRGDVTASAAYEVAKVRNPKKRAKLEAAVLKHKLSREAVISRIRKTTKKKTQRRPRVSRLTVSLWGGVAVVVQGPGLSLENVRRASQEFSERLAKLGQQELELKEAEALLTAGGEEEQ